MFIQSRTLTAVSDVIPLIQGQAALIPVKLQGREGLNDLFEYHLQLSTPDSLHLPLYRAANFDCNTFFDKELTVHIALGAGNTCDTRQITGLITAAQLQGEAGRFVHYQLTLRPWLHLATLNSDCRIYQNKTVTEILDDLLLRYDFPYDKRLIETYPRRDYQTQFNESDYRFFCRLCEQWGINWFFEHHDGKQTLVLIDNMRSHKKNPGMAYQHITYYPQDHRIGPEYLQSFAPAKRLTPARYTTRDYDYTRPKADLTVQRSDPHASAHAHAEVYQWHADAPYSQPKAGADKDGNDALQEGALLARIRLEAHRQQAQQASGSGPLRGMTPGCHFCLAGYPQDSANIDYLITATTLLIEDVAQATQSDSPQAQQYRVAAEFDVHPLNVVFRPQRRTPKPYSHGPQTALVVGPAEQAIWTDQLGRIKVQFPWDRIGQHDHNSSCWIRVASPWAGNQFGSLQLPRIGQEVLIDFLGGDPDLPLCGARLYNQHNLPPWRLPEQSALSGWRSRELSKDGGNTAMGCSNHLIFDDTAGQIQVQLKSDHQHSQLSLGYVTRIEDNQGRKEARGEGFELRTDGHGAVRAKGGLLLSAEARDKAGAHITDMGETVQRLRQARDLQENLAALARKHAAQEHDDQQTVVNSIRAQNAALEGIGEAIDIHGKKPFPELSQPHLLLASPAGIETTTAQSTHIASSVHTAMTSGMHTCIAAGKNFLASAAEHIRLFADNGMRLMARRGKLELAAQNDNIELIAKKVIDMLAEEEILLHAKKGIRMTTDGAIVLSGKQGVKIFSEGKYEVFSAGYQTYGPGALPVSTPDWQTSRFDQEILLKKADGTNAIQRGLDMIGPNGTVSSIATNAQGSTQLQAATGVESYLVRFKSMTDFGITKK